MDPAYYVAAGSLKARSFQLETVANNLSNAATVGYKTENSFFSVFNKAASQARALPLSRYVNDGTVLAQRGMDFSQGSTKATGRSLDLAINGNGFFMVKTPQGEQATRDGRFKLGPKGEIQTQDGLTVLGKNGQSLQVDPQAGAITFGPDGTLQQGTQTIGQLDIRAFENPVSLTRVGQGRFDIQHAKATQPQMTVSQGYQEESTVDVATAMVDMIRINRMFELSMKVASTVSNDLDAKSISSIANGQ